MIVNIRKSDDAVVDVGQEYDLRYFDNAEYPDGTIPAGDPPQLYRRVAGAIQRLNRAQQQASGDPNVSLRGFKDDWQAARDALVADIQALPAGQTKTILIDLVTVLRLMAKFIRFE